MLTWGVQFLQGIDPAVMPLGIITLEDVLEGRYFDKAVVFI